ncbi:hypothetical protein PV779_24555 [Streptomyces sp. ID01-9D]|nr:hypothetical protein [Streptomyces sp. ID01-9D]
MVQPSAITRADATPAGRGDRFGRAGAHPSAITTAEATPAS